MATSTHPGRSGCGSAAGRGPELLQRIAKRLGQARRRVRSGEMNAENVLEIADAAPAERPAAWIDGLRARYPETP